MSLGRKSYLLPLRTTTSLSCVTSRLIRLAVATARETRCPIGALAFHDVVEGG